MRAFIVISIISIFNLNASALGQIPDNLNTHRYDCIFDGNQRLSIHLHIMRNTSATVEAFGQTFTTTGSFYGNMIVSDESAEYDEPSSLYISLNKGDRGFGKLAVHTSQSRAPILYDLRCVKQ